MSSLRDDPVIQWLREARHRISEQFGHDPRRLVEHYIQLQERHKDRFFKDEAAPVMEEKKAA